MMEKEDLVLLSVSELKKIATEIGIKFDQKAKKNELVDVLLKSGLELKPSVEKTELIQDVYSGSLPSDKFNDDRKPKMSNEDIELPKSYGKNKLVFMIRDPYWGFAYWEISNEVFNQYQLYDKEMFIRIYDITTTEKVDSADSFYDVKIDGNASNWYIKLPQANRKYVADYGFFKETYYVSLLRSNVSISPRDDISDQIDAEWSLTDDQFRQILKASGADQMFEQIGSQELMKFLASNVSDNESSDSLASPSSPFGPLN